MASGIALYFMISNVFTIVQYGVEGKLDWAGLKFWEKRAPAPAVKPVRRQSTAGSVKASTVKPKPTPTETAKIDANEFKNKKKPKKTNQ